MDTQTIFLVVAIALFAIALGFAAAAAYVFVKLDIRAVRADLSGKARTKEIAGKSAEKKRAGAVLKGDDDKGGAAFAGKDASPAAGDAGSASVTVGSGAMKRKRGTVEKTRRSKKESASVANDAVSTNDVSGRVELATSAAAGDVETGAPRGSAGGDSSPRATRASGGNDVQVEQRPSASLAPPSVKEIEFTVVRRLVLTAAQQSRD